MSRAVTLPQTFERRGTSVKMYAPRFQHMRVREYIRDEDRSLEAVIPNFSGIRANEFTVVPWKQLPDLQSFEERDEHLIEAILNTTTAAEIEPIAVRGYCMRADSIYHPDEYMRQLAREKTQKEKEDIDMVRMSCLAQLTRECGIARGDAFMAKANTTTLLDLMTGEKLEGGFDVSILIDRVMQFAAERSGTTVEEVRDWLEPLVGMIAPFGTVISGGRERSHGFLYRQHVRLIEFRKSLHETRDFVREEAGESISLINKVSDQAIAYVNQRIVKLDEQLGNLTNVFSSFDSSIGELRKLRRDVSYGLDGWDDLIDVWDDAVEGKAMVGGAEGLERAIRHILDYLPIIPDRELNPDGNVMQGADYERARVRLVAEMHSWSDGSIDTTLRDRVQRAKERKEDDTESKWKAEG